jgi:hypothetical protein
MNNMTRWYAKFHELGPNAMIVPAPRYTEILQSQKEPPMRVLFISMDMGE